jgi:hypothetical protein
MDPVPIEKEARWAPEPEIFSDFWRLVIATWFESSCLKRSSGIGFVLYPVPVRTEVETISETLWF